MMGFVRLKFAMEFDLPDRMSSGDKKRIASLARDVDYLNSISDLPDGVSADRHHLADAIDAVATLANVCRRARAIQKDD